MNDGRPVGPSALLRAVRARLAGLVGPLGLAVALTVLLAGSGLVLVGQLVGVGSLVPGPTGAVLLLAVVVLAAALVATELGQAIVEIRQQAYSFSLTGMPLLVGLFYLPPIWVVAARLVAAVVAFRLQRAAGLKTAYNSAAYLLDTALVATLLHVLVPVGGPVDLIDAVVAYLVLAAVDVLMTSLVLLVIRINVGPLERADVTESFGPAAVSVAAAAGIGLLCVVLLASGPLGWALLVLVSAGTGACYRLYLVLRRRHRSLQLVQGFIDAGGRADAQPGLADDLLGQLRDLLRAETARLEWHSGTGELRTHESHAGSAESGTADPDGTPGPDGTTPGLARKNGSTEPSELLTAPGAMMPPGTDGLVPASTEVPALRSWLTRSGYREALVVDLARFGTEGVLVLGDRLGGEVSRFTPDDLSLARALAGHLVVALRSSDLVERLRWDASHDALTGLPNRRVLVDSLQRLERLDAVDGGHAPTVLVLGVDRFAEVKESLGHAVGEQLLLDVASRLRALDLPGAGIARLGAEEFAVLLPAAAPADVDDVAGRLLAVLDRPVALDRAVISAGASIGIATAAPGTGAAEVLRRADTALVAARADGTRTARYDRSLDNGRAERLALLADLHRALDEGVLEVHYQPKLDLRRGRVDGVEALVRWQHPVLGAVGPAVFVPLAESAGLVDRLTDLVLAASLERSRAWSDAGLDLVVAVNLSTRSLDDPELPERVSVALGTAGVSADRLVLEITETSLMGDPERTLPVLRALAELGVGLSLDDFGTGYSSLAYLQRLPVHELKIDRSFVQALEDPTATASAALVSTIISLAANLGLRVVAEGVESAQAMAMLRALGCEHVQGYLVSRPVPAGALPDVVRAVDADPAWAPGVPAPRTAPDAAAPAG